MDNTDQFAKTEAELPEVDEHVIQALRDSHDFSPNEASDNFRVTVEEDQSFAHQIIIEGHRRSHGDITRQTDFINGATFAREALRRTAALRSLESTDVEEITAADPDELTVQPQLEKTKKRFGFGTMSALVAVFSIFRQTGRRRTT